MPDQIQQVLIERARARSEDNEGAVEIHVTDPDWTWMHVQYNIQDWILPGDWDNIPFPGNAWVSTHQETSEGDPGES